ncbi:MAG: hypothetical protein KBC84_01070 [Proteobacteria bacterium]|nr:hypothetical protein [Pseudomonadota bacterium]
MTVPFKAQISNLVWTLSRPRYVFEWVKRWKTVPVFSWLRAADCFLKKDFVSAAIHYNRGINKIKEHPALFCAKLDYAYCLYRTGELNEPLKILNRMCLELTPHRDCYLLGAKINYYLGKFDSAAMIIKNGLILFPLDISLLCSMVHYTIFNKGEISSIEEYISTLASLKRTISLDDARQQLIDTAVSHYHLYSENFEEGERILARVLAAGNAPYEAVYIKAERLFDLGRIIPAREQLSRAIRLAPRSPYPQRLLAESYLLDTEFAEPEWAVQFALKSVKLSNWKNITCLQTLIKAYQRNNDHTTAELVEERCKSIETDYKYLPLSQLKIILSDNLPRTAKLT